MEDKTEKVEEEKIDEKIDIENVFDFTLFKENL